MSAESTRLAQLDPLIDSKNPNVRNEAAAAFAKFSIYDEKVISILTKHLTSQTWDTRVCAGRALQAVLSSFQEIDEKKEENTAVAVSEKLRAINVSDVLKKFKPLLSESESTMKGREKCVGNNQKQREFVDQHLELSHFTGLSSKKFLSDDEFVIGTAGTSSDTNTDNAELDEVIKKEEPEEEKVEEELERRKLLDKHLKELINLVFDKKWYSRHGGALAVCQIASTSYSRLSSELVDSTLYLLIHVLILDKFNDFITGRNATAPVREQCAQALVHILRNTDETRRDVVLRIVVDMVQTPGENNWNVRQSGLLILKYYFAIARSDNQLSTFNRCFDLVIQAVNDPVDDVIGCAVKTLSSILSNKEIPPDEMSQLVEKVMAHVWTLLAAETAKEQLRAGLDSLCIDLLEIIDLWLNRNPSIRLSRDQLSVVSSMLDASFPVRSDKIIRLLDVNTEREQNGELKAEEAFRIIKQLYRIILFTPPTDSLAFLERAYVTFTRIFRIYRQKLIDHGEISRKVGNWMSCLLLDNRNPHIHVFDNDVDGISSDPNSPLELMGSEEMRFLGEREREDVYLTRKILSAKFLSHILEALYESNAKIQGQKVDLAVQLLFVPFFQSTIIMHNLGVSIVVNEWAAQYRSSVNAQITDKPPPITIVQLSDSIVRSAPPKQYDEQTNIVHTLTKDCNDFIEYCVVRGFDKSSAEQSGGTVDDISRMAYESVKSTLDTDKKREALETRYTSVTRAIESAKTNIRANAIRINALLSSALFYFGNTPEKLTPQIRPIVDTMQSEENDSVSSEVFRGAVPLLVMYSWSRNPRPYVKVLAKVIESYAACSVRLPPISSRGPDNQQLVISLRRLSNETEDASDTLDGKISAASKNAELFMTILCQFNSNQVPEFYAYFDLGEEVDMNTFLIRLELHNSFWNRVGSRLSDQSVEKIFSLVPSEDPTIRFAFAKAIETFCKSNRGDTLNRCYHRLVKLSDDLEDVNARLTAVEVFLRLSSIETPILRGWATLFAPVVFRLLNDQCNAIRDAAGEAFRRLIPVVTIESATTTIEGLNEELNAKRLEYSNFINVLGSPSSLPRVIREDILGGFDASLLREYQLEGITWIRFLRKYGLNGILADDMGLGKTLQTMCSIALSVDMDGLERRQRCSLIVCPKTLVDHWCIEWNRFFPNRPAASKSIPKIRDAEICVIPYEDLKTPQVLDRVWNYVVLDEGHVMRNPKLRAWTNTRLLVCKSRLILSGTPVQNSPADLWALFSWLMPGYLGSEAQFRTQFLKKIMRCRMPKVTEAELATGAVAMNQLHKLILPFVMRRLKTEVLKELPDKNVQDYQCELTEEQKDIYRYLVNKCSMRDNVEGGISTLVCLIALRKMTDHTSLVLDTLNRVGAPKEILNKAANAPSGKMEALKQLLIECNICQNPDDETGTTEEIEGPNESGLGHRALIFCQWQTSARLVSKMLSSGEFGSVVPHLILDGTVRPQDRMKVVQQFNEDKTIDVLILTTHVGGVGLNLTGADTVIFLDHDWNPMKDLQAIDRAHRLGQTRKVNVYRLITTGTIEEKVMNLAKFKLNTAQALIGADNQSMMTMETGELMEMFTLDGDANEKKTTPGEPATKRKRASTGAASKIEEVDLANIWDESQYDDFQVDTFLKSGGPSS